MSAASVVRAAAESCRTSAICSPRATTNSPPFSPTHKMANAVPGSGAGWAVRRSAAIAPNARGVMPANFSPAVWAINLTAPSWSRFKAATNAFFSPLGSGTSPVV